MGGDFQEADTHRMCQGMVSALQEKKKKQKTKPGEGLVRWEQVLLSIEVGGQRGVHLKMRCVGAECRRQEDSAGP